MTPDLAPNKFRLRTKIAVGLPVVLFVIVGILYDPELYIAVVGFATLPIAIAFPLVYMTLPWKQTILGRALMTKARAVALLYIAGLLSSVWNYPFHGYVMALVTTYLAIGIGFQFVVLLRIKYEAKQPDPRLPERTALDGQNS